MPQKTVTVVIEDGNLSVDLNGYQGKGCKEVAKAFASIGTVTQDVTKPAYYQGPGGPNSITQGR